jgi:hypothetical protein
MESGKEAVQSTTCFFYFKRKSASIAKYAIFAKRHQVLNGCDFCRLMIAEKYVNKVFYVEKT